MIIDHQFHPVAGPRKYHLETLNFKNFTQKADKIVNSFYRALIHAYHAHPHFDVKIEYKIVHQVSHELADFYKPSDRSDYVRKKFMQIYAITKSVVVPMKLSQQLRSRLKRPELDEFKKSLRKMHVVKPSRTNTYQYHLWILATHATKSNYKKILKRLSKSEHLIHKSN